MTSGDRIQVRIALAVVLCAAALVRVPGVVDRPIGQDEAITLLTVSGDPSPSWPSEPTPARKLKAAFFDGTGTHSEISEALRRIDVHPPGYFWALTAWRQWFGTSLEAARLFSVGCSLGAVAVFLLLLVRAGYASPLTATAVYALTTSAVHSGYDARPYALASMLVLIGVLLAYRAKQSDERGRNVVQGTIAGAILGLALYVHYLTLFPSLAVLIWLSFRHRTGSWTRAVTACTAFFAVAALSVPNLLAQLDARPNQFAGFVGVAAELQSLLVQNLLVAWAPTESTYPVAPAVYAGLLALVLWTGVRLRRTWSTENRGLWWLLFGLVVSPSLGVLLLDVVFDKQLHLPRYFVLAAPATSVFLVHGFAGLVAQRKKTGYMLLCVLLLVLWIPGWESGTEKLLGYPRGESDTWMDSIEKLENVVVAVGAGGGRGGPAAVVYELGSTYEGTEIDAFVIREGSDASRTAELLGEYSQVWVVRSSWGETGPTENELLDRLAESSEFIWSSSHGSATHFRNLSPER